MTSFQERFTCFSQAVSLAAGKPAAFALAVAAVLVWAACGPWAGYSDHWQIVINTGTTIVTFLMVFLIQASQNRDGAAIQAKLDELIRSSAARNDLIAVEQDPSKTIDEIRRGP